MDSEQHMAGKNFFCNPDYSQPYHCLQMADQQSIELLAFNFASRTFAYRRLAQGLSCSLSGFSGFIREYFDTVIKPNQSAQNVDDNGIAPNNLQKLIKNLRAVFECLRKAGLRLNIAKCHFGVQEVDFLGRTKTTKGVAPQSNKLPNFSKNSNFHHPRKHFSDTSDFRITIGTTYLDWQNNSCRFSNCSKQRMPKPKFRSPLTS